MKSLSAAAAFVLLGGLVGAQPATAPPGNEPTLATLQAEIAALEPAEVAWRGISWKSCLLEGLKESRRRNQPALLWVFIDRPADDARC